MAQEAQPEDILAKNSVETNDPFGGKLIHRRINTLNLAAVKSDIEAVLTTSLAGTGLVTADCTGATGPLHDPDGVAQARAPTASATAAAAPAPGNSASHR